MEVIRIIHRLSKRTSRTLVLEIRAPNKRRRTVRRQEFRAKWAQKYHTISNPTWVQTRTHIT
jgi:hypothetical protein